MLRLVLPLLVSLALLSLSSGARALTVRDASRHFELNVASKDARTCRMRPVDPPEAELCEGAAAAQSSPVGAGELFAGVIDRGGWKTTLLVLRATDGGRELGPADIARYGKGLIAGFNAKAPPGTHYAGDPVPTEMRIAGVQVLKNTIVADAPGGASTRTIVFAAATSDGFYEMLFSADEGHGKAAEAEADRIVESLRATPAPLPTESSPAFTLGYVFGQFFAFGSVAFVVGLGIWYARRAAKRSKQG
jgi:hypothetical protein